MIRLRKVKVAAAFAIVAAGIASAMLIPASPAVAYYSGGLFLDITVLSPARLIAGGAAIDVPVEYTCNATPSTYVTVSVTQRVGKGVASGNADTRVICSGGHQRTTLTVTATTGGKAFIKGNAYASGYITGCLEYYNCGSETRGSTIQIRR